MPKFTKDSLPFKDYGPVEEGHTEIDGWAIDFTTFKVDLDGAPMLKGLPGDQCGCPHWGYVFAGRLTFRFPDHDEVIEPGEAFYVPAGHIPIVEAGTNILMFSPADELRRTADAMQRNVAAMQGA